MKNRANGHEWEKKISDPSERKVFEALSNREWNLRTLAGIAKETGLSEPDVTRILEKYPQFIRKSEVLDREGNNLFTLRSNPIKFKERLAVLRMYLAGWAD